MQHFQNRLSVCNNSSNHIDTLQFQVRKLLPYLTYHTYLISHSFFTVPAKLAAISHEQPSHPLYVPDAACRARRTPTQAPQGKGLAGRDRHCSEEFWQLASGDVPAYQICLTRHPQPLGPRTQDSRTSGRLHPERRAWGTWCGLQLRRV